MSIPARPASATLHTGPCPTLLQRPWSFTLCSSTSPCPPSRAGPPSPHPPEKAGPPSPHPPEKAGPLSPRPPSRAGPLCLSMSTWEGRASISTPTQQGRACPRPPRWTPLHPFFCQLPWDSEPVSTERNLYIQTRGHTGLNELDICSDTDSKASSMYQMET